MIFSCMCIYGKNETEYLFEAKSFFASNKSNLYVESSFDGSISSGPCSLENRLTYVEPNLDYNTYKDISLNKEDLLKNNIIPNMKEYNYYQAIWFENNDGYSTDDQKGYVKLHFYNYELNKKFFKESTGKVKKEIYVYAGNSCSEIMRNSLIYNDEIKNISSVIKRDNVDILSVGDIYGYKILYFERGDIWYYICGNENISANEMLDILNFYYDNPINDFSVLKM